MAWLASQLYREHVQTVYVADDVPGTGPVEPAVLLFDSDGISVRSLGEEV